MIEVKITKSRGGIYTANYEGGWNMQIDKEKCIEQAKKILIKQGYDESDIVLDKVSQWEERSNDEWCGLCIRNIPNDPCYHDIEECKKTKPVSPKQIYEAMERYADSI